MSTERTPGLLPWDATDADAHLTAERDEIKYLVAREQAHDLALGLSGRLPHHRFTGEGANRLPRPRHFVTTIYFDTPSRDQYRAAHSDSQHNLKMRAKEYYDLHPSLAELATDPRQIVKYKPVLWLELKFKDGTRSGKRRIGIPKAQVPAFFSHGVITSEMVEFQRPFYGPESEAVLREIAEYCGRYDEPMQADSLVNYRRIPWQDEKGHLRVTLDVGIEFYVPPPDLWERRQPLVRESLGRAVGRLDAAVLEVKSNHALPVWLTDLRDQVSADQIRFSKFEAASQAVHGRPHSTGAHPSTAAGQA